MAESTTISSLDHNLGAVETTTKFEMEHISVSEIEPQTETEQAPEMGVEPEPESEPK